MNIFYPSVKTFVLGAQRDRRIEFILFAIKATIDTKVDERADDNCCE